MRGVLYDTAVVFAGDGIRSIHIDGQPEQCINMIARVRGVIAASNDRDRCCANRDRHPQTPGARRHA